MVLLLTKKETSKQKGNRGLTVILPAFPTRCPLGSTHRIYITVAWGGLPLSYQHIQQYTKIINHTLKKEHGFLTHKDTKEKQNDAPLGDWRRRDSRQRRPLPNGQHTGRGGTPPGGMDADNCDDAPSSCESKLLTRRTDTRINKRKTNSPKKRTIYH